MVDLSRVNRRELLILVGLVVVTVVGVGVALSLTGTKLPGISGPAAQETSPPVTLREIPVTTKVAKVAGGLPTKTRREAERQIDVLLTTYVANAFLGDYPSKDFADTWAVFTDGIAPSAKKDADLLTGERWSDQTLRVNPGKLVAQVAILADHKKPVGATASITFKFQPEIDGQAAPAVTLKGRLILTRVNGEWRIFGYDVTAPSPKTGANE